MAEELMGAYGSRMVIAVLGVGIGLLFLFGILWMLRGRNGPSPFVRGGRNRNPRLQVLDAAAVDARRRLVLIRRDGVEHLVMIGGPTDIVIETGIATNSPSQPSAIESAPSEPRPALAQRQRPDPRPAALPEAERPEPMREISVRDDTPRAKPPLATQPSPIPARPVSPVSRSEPTPTASVSPPAPQRLDPPARQSAPEPQRPAPTVVIPATVSTAAGVATAPIAAAAITAIPQPAPSRVDDAANALEAARSRVLAHAEPAQPTEPSRVVPINPEDLSTGGQPALEKPKMLGSDFEKILEEEMAQNLAARENAGRETIAAPAPNRQLPQRDPAVAPITGATAEPSLQDEVARIFGEMSATRDK
ncbi:MAG: flagellar biosynthesis protein FliO [Rhizobiaceae bacterium]|nr:MAG: flagellar biosynthesis protein FliO [Rhizobiaceae bacterium]